MFMTLRVLFTTWRRSFCLACTLYGASWLFGILITAKFAPPAVLHNLQISPVTTYSAWSYISHNVGVEGVLLLGACTFGIGTGLVLCLNGLFDGMIVTAIAQHYGIGVVLVGLLPHGLLETSAWILVSTCGFLLSGRFKHIIFSLWNTKSTGTSEQTIDVPADTQNATHATLKVKFSKDAYLYAIIISTLMLILAGTIEAYISPIVIKILISSIK
jgi:uncharacterized membrane protein SpoIIM required for sporulation